ncbi:MAG: FHA domain-containing protein, partial [Prevotella sp.]|nr:FHA domain-containing protein [Prevotella sp.]
IGKSKLRDTQKEENPEDLVENDDLGAIIVIENVFHYKQIIPLKMGDNVIGRYQKGNPINTPIETVDPSVDNTHCVINVSRDKKGKLKYVLRDGPSNTGTFVDNEILGDRERRVIEDGALFTIGATSIILRGSKEE